MCFQTTNLKTLVTLILLLSFNYCFSQKDTVNLRETIITDTKPASLYSEKSRIVQVINREEIAKAPVQSINELLEYAINVDVRNRGANSVQSDIGIRGGSFEQTLVLLNGVKINDPQTGHHTMNIPVELSDVERIEILEGPGSRIYGVNAFAGAINIVTNTQTDNFVKLSAGGGEYQTYNTNAAISFNNGKSHNYLSISKKTSDGYINNTDYNIGNIFYQSDLNTNAGKATVQFGYTNKKFGAGTCVDILAIRWCYRHHGIIYTCSQRRSIECRPGIAIICSFIDIIFCYVDRRLATVRVESDRCTPCARSVFAVSIACTSYQ